MTMKTNWLRSNALRLSGLTTTIIFGGLLACGGGGGGSIQSSPEPIVTPTDTTPPVITVIGSLNLTIEQGSSYTDSGAKATDAVDGSVTAITSGTIADAVGVYTIT